MADKFCTTQHAFFLECDAVEGLVKYNNSVHSVTTDLCMEFGVCDCSATYSSLFPWAHTELGDARMQQEMDLGDLPMDDAEVSMHGAMSIPGMLHIIHNAGNSLSSVM